MDQNSPIDRIHGTLPGQPISASKLTRQARAIMRMNAGFTPPQQVIKKPIGSGGGGRTAENAVLYAHAASTANLTLSGAQTVDGIALTAGMWCLAKNQSTASQNDLYIVKTGAWSRVGTSAAPTDAVIVLNGTAGGRLFFTRSGTTYSANKAVYG